MSDRIIVRGLRFHGHHGVFEAEREIGQWYSIDMDLFTDLRRAGESDELSASVDYGDVCRRVLSVGTERSFFLIEALAEAVAKMVLEVFPVDAVRVQVTKTPPAALAHALSNMGTIEFSAVDITRTREPRLVPDTSTRT